MYRCTLLQLNWKGVLLNQADSTRNSAWNKKTGCGGARKSSDSSLQIGFPGTGFSEARYEGRQPNKVSPDEYDKSKVCHV